MNVKFTAEQVKRYRSREYTDTIIKDIMKETNQSYLVVKNMLEGKTYGMEGARPVPRQSNKQLDNTTIEQIRKELEEAYWGQQTMLAAKYKVSRNTIQRIAQGKI